MPKANIYPSKEYFDQHLNYDAETGTLTWITDQGKRKSGTIAGTKNETTGYWYIVLNYKKYYLHRVAWIIKTGEILTELDDIDHDNGNKDDNSFINLIKKTHQANRCNNKVRSDSPLGYPGIKIEKRTGKFYARISVYGTEFSLGTHDTFEAAKEARVKAEIEFGFKTR